VPDLSEGLVVWNALAILELFVGDGDISQKLELLEQTLVFRDIQNDGR
jgi:hypothetical protein